MHQIGSAFVTYAEAVPPETKRPTATVPDLAVLDLCARRVISPRLCRPTGRTDFAQATSQGRAPGARVPGESRGDPGDRQRARAVAPGASVSRVVGPLSPDRGTAPRRRMDDVRRHLHRGAGRHKGKGAACRESPGPPPATRTIRAARIEGVHTPRRRGRPLQHPVRAAARPEPHRACGPRYLVRGPPTCVCGSASMCTSCRSSWRRWCLPATSSPCRGSRRRSA
jgi:hypothetical protein